MIELRGIGFSYGEAEVLRGIELSVGEGEIVCVVGPNGAGKTTLLRIVGGLLAPTSGTAVVLGVDPVREPRRRLAKRLCYLPQSYRLAFPYRVGDVVMMGRYAHGGSFFGIESDEDVAAARAAMERCDVLALADRRFDQLSGGEQRRVLLAQAFAQGASLVLLDEPTASLDPAHALAVMTALRAERDRRRATAVVVTHDINLAARAADRVVVVHRGAITADGAPADVLRSAAAADAFALPMHVGTLPSGEPFAVPG